MSMSYAEKAGLWAYYGKTEMSSLCSQLLLLHNSGDKKQQMFNGSSTCQAVVNVANIFVELGEYLLAEVVLEHAKDRFPNEPSNKVTINVWRDIMQKKSFSFIRIVCFLSFTDMDVERTIAQIHTCNEARKMERIGSYS